MRHPDRKSMIEYENFSHIAGLGSRLLHNVMIGSAEQAEKQLSSILHDHLKPTMVVADVLRSIHQSLLSSVHFLIIIYVEIGTCRRSAI